MNDEGKFTGVCVSRLLFETRFYDLINARVKLQNKKLRCIHRN